MSDENCLFLAAEHDKLAHVKVLLDKCHSNPNVTDKQGRTPFDLATDTNVMLLLLKHGAQVDNVYKSHSKHIGKLASERPPDNPLAIFITGDGGVGKSTMLKSMLSSKGFRAIFIKAKPVTGVDEKTVGIIPHEVVTKEFGRVICYDFAGQQEFYASHCAVLENAVQTSPPIIIYLAHLQNSEQKIADSTAWWMTLVQNQCTNLTGKAHVIVVGSHADKVKESGENPRDKETMFAPIIKKFSHLEFIAFTPMDCRFPDSDQMKEVKKQIQKSSAILRSPDTVSLNAHTFYIYLLDSFKDDPAVSLRKVQQRIHNDLDQTQSKRAKSLLSFIPSTLPRLVEICDQLNKKGLVLYLHNESSPEKSFIVCDRVTLLSNVTGTVFAPEGFRQHCSIATSTGVVPLSKFAEQFKDYDIQMLLAFMTHLEFCFEIVDKEVLVQIIQLANKSVDNSFPPDADGRYLFFPGLIRINIPERVWEEAHSELVYHFGWILQCSQDIEFFDPRCLQVLILRIVFAFGLAPASRIQQDIPSLQRFCSVWKNGISWCNKDGVTSHLELSDSGKSFALKVRCRQLNPECLAIRSKTIKKVLQTVKDFCSNIKTTESIIDPQQVIKHPLKPSSELTLCSISNTALAITSSKKDVMSEYQSLPLKHLLKFEPYAHLDQDTLQCIHSEKNVMKNEKISNTFISHFTSQIRSAEDIEMYTTLLQPRSTPSTVSSSLEQELIQALESWRNETEGTYSCLKETLDMYSIFTGRNPLDLAGVAHSDTDPSIFPEPGPDQLPLTKVMELIKEVRSDWYSLAIQLEIAYGIRKSIQRTHHHDVDDCFQIMLKHWIRRLSPPPSWGSLIRALQSPTIERGKMTAEKIKTMPELAVEESSDITTTSTELSELNGPLSVDKHLKVVREAVWDVRAKWYHLGVELGVEVETLDVIQQNHPNVTNACFTSLLETWLTQIPPPTLNSLIEALKSPVIDRGDIARNIEDMLGK